MIEITTKRLTSACREEARLLFTLMAMLFAEECETLSDDYLDQLLGRREFWTIAAFSAGEIVGGLTAHSLPMTRTASSEIFIYDIAARPDWQRKGVGRQLIAALREQASGLSVADVFVAADNDDRHALDFYRAVGGSASPVMMFTFPA